MRRREFIAGLGAAAATPLGVRAQQSSLPQRIARVGLLNYATAQYARVDDFRRELRTLGYVEGQNLTIAHRWADGRSERLPQLAAELASGNDVIIALGPAAWAAKRATSTVPIVIAFSGDLVGTGMVSNLARPGENVTGFSYLSTDLAAKRFELLSQTFSGRNGLAVFYNPAEPATALELKETETAARTIGVTLIPVTARQPEDIAEAFAAASREQADGMVLFTHGFVELNRDRIIEQAAHHRLPTMYGWRDFVIAGGLMSYGPDVQALVRKAASYVDRIIKGEKPGDLPVEQPARLDLVINLKTARTLGIEIPSTLLARADEVIE
jgi:putative tryptophan/tyrosine transport system substrate-binding protein